MPQVMLGMLEPREGIFLDLVVAPNSNHHSSMASVRGEIYLVDLDRCQAWIGHLEADELDELLFNCFRYPPRSPLVHIKLSAISFQPFRARMWHNAAVFTE